MYMYVLKGLDDVISSFIDAQFRIQVLPAETVGGKMDILFN